ncbi:hypothetical protein [Bradyrhizobium sp. Tv2a-2]|uniref:hypothetical protein n=1 Tax=Bradyrhizobium sp. Tv2a-2 TaxID=113395 RepID=UPI0003F9FFE0|nr:hypothetical protein [Bradyrhizobium sp. Tv2a-2]
MKQMGYILVDHRASPGLPEDIARAAGYDPKFCGEGKVFEQDTMTCSHCKSVVVKNNARTRERAKCFECDNKEGHYICDGCDFIRREPGYVHTPFTKFIDDHLAVAANPCSTRDLPTAPGVTLSGTPQKLLLP